MLPSSSICSNATCLSPSASPPPPSAAIRLCHFDIWQSIISHLDLPSVVSLSHTCHHLWKLLGARTRRDLYHCRESRLSFLTLLSQALPQHWLCAHCCIWHPISTRVAIPQGEPCHIPREDPTSTLTSSNPYRVSIAVAPNLELTFPTVFDAVRFHKYGQTFGLPLPGYTDSIMCRPQCPWRWSLTSKVVNGSLLIKTAASCVMPDILQLSCQERNRLFARPGCGLGEAKYATCRHVNLEGPINDALLYCKVTNVGSRWTNMNGMSRNCDHCATEWRIEFDADIKKVWTCTITRWTDLGSCLHAYTLPWRRAVASVGVIDPIERPRFICPRFEGTVESEYAWFRPPPG